MDPDLAFSFPFFLLILLNCLSIVNDKEELPVPEGTILFIYLPTELCSSTWIRMQTIFTQIKGAEVDIRVWYEGAACTLYM